MSDQDSITLENAILFIMFKDGENFKQMTAKMIFDDLAEKKWLSDLKISDIEEILKNNDKNMFKVHKNNDENYYELDDVGIKYAHNIHFY